MKESIQLCTSVHESQETGAGSGTGPRELDRESSKQHRVLHPAELPPHQDPGSASVYTNSCNIEH